MRAEKSFFVYILANKAGGATYVGMTSNLPARIWQHRNHVFEGFTSRHDITSLVYYEPHGNAESAIRREKQVKDWHRIWKVELIEKSNPLWLDLYDDLFG